MIFVMFNPGRYLGSFVIWGVNSQSTKMNKVILLCQNTSPSFVENWVTQANAAPICPICRNLDNNRNPQPNCSRWRNRQDLLFQYWWSDAARQVDSWHNPPAPDVEWFCPHEFFQFQKQSSKTPIRPRGCGGENSLRQGASEPPRLRKAALFETWDRCSGFWKPVRHRGGIDDTYLLAISFLSRGWN